MNREFPPVDNIDLNAELVRVRSGRSVSRDWNLQFLTLSLSPSFFRSFSLLQFCCCSLLVANNSGATCHVVEKFNVTRTFKTFQCYARVPSSQNNESDLDSKMYWWFAGLAMSLYWLWFLIRFLGVIDFGWIVVKVFLFAYANAVMTVLLVFVIIEITSQFDMGNIYERISASRYFDREQWTFLWGMRASVCVATIVFMIHAKQFYFKLKNLYNAAYICKHTLL